MNGWRWNRRVAIVVTAVALAIQFVVPTWVFFVGVGDHVPRFGWQMYSTVTQVTTYVVHTGAGTTEVRSGRYTAIPRADLPLHRLIPAHLCKIIEGAEKVTWEGGEFRC
jgi:hypothetical protein